MNHKSRKKPRVFAIIPAIVCIATISCFYVNAQETKTVQTSDIVFLLDCSQSMSEIDEEYMAPDFIKELVCASPSHYRFGLVGYNREISISAPLGSGI